MEKFGRCFKWITFTYVILVLALIFAYGFFVKGGSWGSLSDIVIAVFTVLIAYTTNMLLIAAWLTSNSWLDQSKHSSAQKLLLSLSEYYFTIHEIKTMYIEKRFLESFTKITPNNYHNLSSQALKYFEGTPKDVTQAQLTPFLDFLLPTFTEEAEKFKPKIHAIKEKLNQLKFEVMTKASPFAIEIEQLDFDLITEINFMLTVDEGMHKNASQLFDKLSAATGYDGFKLIYIADPVKNRLFKHA